MNLPNQLTLSRLFLTFLFVAALSSDWRFAHTAALALFILAGITDYADGEIARRRNLVTDFGKLMDPLADKIMMAGAFICLVPRNALPAWFAVAIIGREFLITGLRLLAASKGVVLPAEKMGKHKTIWQIVTVCYLLTLLSVAEMERAGWLFAGTPWAYAWNFGGPFLLTLTLTLTLCSAFRYFWKNWGFIAKGPI